MVTKPERNTKRTLSTREQQVLEHLAAGNKREDIAGRMGISFHTVKTHLKHIYKKTGAQSQAQATAWYYTRFIKEFKNSSKFQQ